MAGCSKSVAQRIHFRRRAASRLGVEFNKKKRRELTDLIKKGKATLVRKVSNRVKIYLAVFQGKSFNVVYDAKRQNPITVLLVPSAERATPE